MFPAQQGFSATYLAAGYICLSLVMQRKLITFQCQSQILFKREQEIGTQIHFCSKELEGATPFFLGTIHRSIGILDQLFDILRIAWVNADAYTGMSKNLQIINSMSSLY